MANPVETGHHPRPAADLTLHGRLRHRERGFIDARGCCIVTGSNLEAGTFAALRDVYARPRISARRMIQTVSRYPTPVISSVSKAGIHAVGMA